MQVTILNIFIAAITNVKIHLAIAIGFLCAIAPATAQFSSIIYQPTDSTALVRLIIGNTKLAIPQNYTRFKSDRDMGEKSAVTMHALLPNLEPFTKNNAESFGGIGVRKGKIEFFLRSQSRILTNQYIFDRRLRFVKNVKGEIGPYNLTKYEFKQPSPYRNRILLVSFHGENASHSITCPTVKNKGVCEVISPMFPKVRLEYSFHHSDLKKWKEINDKIRALIQTFKISSEKNSR